MRPNRCAVASLSSLLLAAVAALRAGACPVIVDAEGAAETKPPILVYDEPTSGLDPIGLAAAFPRFVCAIVGLTVREIQ